MQTAMPPQEIIEKKMRQIVQLGNYEAAYLFSAEGLYIAKAAARDDVDPDRLAEISMLLGDVKRLAATLGGIERLAEVFMEGDNHRKIIFRFFKAFGEDVVLVAVVPPRKAYRKHTNDLQKIVNAFAI